MLNDISRTVRDLVFSFIVPSRCVSCGRPVTIGENGLCRGCIKKIIPVTGACEKCSGFVVHDVCSVCSDRAMYLDRNYTMAEYSGIIETVLHRLKFGKERRLSKPLGMLLLKNFGSALNKFDCITSVPMNRPKKWKRGFNQSELIARVVAQKTGCPYVELLREMRSAGTQKLMKSRDRFINILGRYAVVSDDKVLGKTLLLVDDVFTTGATINECARVLKRSGARHVYVLTIARAGIKKLEKAYL